MTCTRCGGHMTAKTVNFCACEAHPPLMIRNVPAMVCDQCGGEVFTMATAKVFERIKRGDAPKPFTSVINVYDFQQTVSLGRRVNGAQFIGSLLGSSGEQAWVFSGST